MTRAYSTLAKRARVIFLRVSIFRKGFILRLFVLTSPMGNVSEHASSLVCQSVRHVAPKLSHLRALFEGQQ